MINSYFSIIFLTIFWIIFLLRMFGTGFLKRDKTKKISPIGDDKQERKMVDALTRDGKKEKKTKKVNNTQRRPSKRKPLTNPQFLMISISVITFLVVMVGVNFFSSIDKIPFTCNNGLYYDGLLGVEEVTIADLTDGKHDCADGSDEDHATTLDHAPTHPSSAQRAGNYTGYDDGEGEILIFGLLFLLVVPASVFATYRARKRNQTQLSIVLLSIVLMFSSFFDYDENQTWECENGEEISNIYFYNDGYVHCLDGTDEIDSDTHDTKSGPAPVFDWISYWLLYPFLLGAVYLFTVIIQQLLERKPQQKT